MAWPPSPPGDDDLPRRCRSPSTSPPRIGRRRSCPAVIRASTSLGSSCYAHDGVTSCEDGTIIIRSSRVVPLSMRKVVCRLSRGKTIVYGSLSDDDLTDTYVPTTPAEHLEFDKVDKTFKISRSESDNLVKHECRDYLKLADEAEPEQPRKELGFEIVSSGKDYAEAGEIFPLGFEIVSGGKDFCDEAVEQLPSAEHSFLLWDFMLSDQMHCKKDLIEVTDIAVGPQIVSNADVLFTFDELSSMTTNFESSNLIPSLDNTFYGFHPTHGKVVVRVFLRSETSQTRMYESALCRPKSHPNVATFLGRSCDDPDFLCIVYKLPYCDTLATILNDPSFDLSKRLRVALCVARGVEYLTAFDKFPSAPLSPDHIFLQEDGSALIMDYLGDTAGKTEDIISQYSAILLLLFPSSLKVNGGETILKVCSLLAADCCDSSARARPSMQTIVYVLDRVLSAL